MGCTFFSFVLQQLISFCISWVPKQSEVDRGWGLWGPRASSSSFPAHSLWASSLTPVPVLSLGKVGFSPWVPSSVEGVKLIFVGFYRETLCPGLDLVFLGIDPLLLFHKEMTLFSRPPLSSGPGRRGGLLIKFFSDLLEAFGGVCFCED